MAVRWLIHRDMDEVCLIERLCFDDEAHSYNDIVAELKHRNQIGVVATANDMSMAVQGYCIYRLHKRCIEIRRLAVDPYERRGGVASEMVGRLIEKTGRRRKAIIARVPEQYLEFLLLLRYMGFVATDVCDGEVMMVYSVEAELCRWRSPEVMDLVGG